jgi:MoxR-like ATPase
MSQFTSDLRVAFYRLGQIFPTFEEQLVQALFALVTEEHILWVSKPGRAKSQLSNAIFGLFPDAPMFATQLTKDMLPDSLFGNIIPDELMKTGKEKRFLDGGIADVMFARLEEFFDGSDYLIRSLLTVLNERMYEAKDQRVKAPLHTAICTTNFMRQREVTEAVMDRIMCKAVIAGVKDLTDVMRAGDSYINYAAEISSLPTFSYGDLKALSDQVQSPDGILLTPAMRMLHVLLLQEFQDRRIQAAAQAWHNDPANANAADNPSDEELGVPEITPRTLVRAFDFSRAAAALNDRTEVTPADQRALVYGTVTIGDKSGDEQLWHSLCDDYLTLSTKQLKMLDVLADIAVGVGQLKKERAQTTGMQLMIGGQMVQRTALDLQQVLANFRRDKHPVLAQAFDRLDSEISNLTVTPVTGFDLVKGW